MMTCRNLKRFIHAVLILAALYFGIHFNYWMFVDATGPAPIREMSEQERIETKRLFKKHGIRSAVCDWNGQNCYFVRDGRKCRLI